MGLIEDGGHDAAGGTSRSPQATRSISTLRANVESWLPPQHVSALYKAGYEAASNPADVPRIAQGLDETCTTLYARCDIDIGLPYSQRVFNDASSNNGGDTGDSAAMLLEGPHADPNAVYGRRGKGDRRASFFGRPQARQRTPNRLPYALGVEGRR